MSGRAGDHHRISREDVPPAEVPPESLRRELERADFRDRLRQDAQRHARREPGHRSFWRSLGLLGMVGWPIALGALGGTLLGRYVDQRAGGGVQFTLMLMIVGIAIGCTAAWRAVRAEHR